MTRRRRSCRIVYGVGLCFKEVFSEFYFFFKSFPRVEQVWCWSRILRATVRTASRTVPMIQSFLLLRWMMLKVCLAWLPPAGQTQNLLNLWKQLKNCTILVQFSRWRCSGPCREVWRRTSAATTSSWRLILSSKSEPACVCAAPFASLELIVLLLGTPTTSLWKRWCRF